MPAKKTIKKVLAVDYDPTNKRVGNWVYKNDAEYKKAVKDGHYSTVTDVVLLDIEVVDGALTVKPR
jgi:hypothetical protein